MRAIHPQYSHKHSIQIDIFTLFETVRNIVESSISEEFQYILCNVNLYQAYLEATDYLEDENLYDILIGSKNGDNEIFIYCLWSSYPLKKPGNKYIKNVYPTPIMKPRIDITASPDGLSFDELFEMNDLVSWVAFGTVDDHIPGFLVGTIYPNITPYGQKAIPTVYQNYPVYQVDIPYQPYGHKGVLKMGEKIAPADLLNGYGTLGCFIEDDNGIYILSNYHVLKTSESSKERKIIQYGISSLGAVDSAAKLAFLKKNTSSEEKGLRNEYTIGKFMPEMSLRGIYTYEIGLDVGIARLAPQSRKIVPDLIDGIVSENLVIIPNGKVRSVPIGTQVYKYGAVTNVTKGVTMFDDSIHVRYNPQYLFYTSIDKALVENKLKSILLPNQILITATPYFCQGGDSGSLAFDEDGNAVGLIHGGFDRYGLASDMVVVMDFLKKVMQNPRILAK